jgi:protein-S-isoprenylcysteine O-methyltransferase Ste14
LDSFASLHAAQEDPVFAIIYSIASYVLFLGVYLYFAAFSDAVFVPKSVDSGGALPAGWAIPIDLGLILVFGLQHSIMARSGFKQSISRVVPQHVERATYVLVSSAALALVMWQWQPLAVPLWRVESEQTTILLWVLNVLGWLGVPLSSLMIDHFDLFGIKQTFAHFRRASMKRTGFVTPLLYKYVRHPMMTSFFIAFWVTPQMTVGHALLSLGMSLYVLIGVHFEERALVRELGLDYERYRATTPKFVPLGVFSTPVVSKSSERDSTQQGV